MHFAVEWEDRIVVVDTGDLIVSCLFAINLLSIYIYYRLDCIYDRQSFSWKMKEGERQR